MPLSAYDPEPDLTPRAALQRMERIKRSRAKPLTLKGFLLCAVVVVLVVTYITIGSDLIEIAFGNLFMPD